MILIHVQFDKHFIFIGPSLGQRLPCSQATWSLAGAILLTVSSYLALYLCSKCCIFYSFAKQKQFNQTPFPVILEVFSNVVINAHLASLLHYTNLSRKKLHWTNRIVLFFTIILRKRFPKKRNIYCYKTTLST